MASIFDDLPKIAVESVTKSNLWMPDTEFMKYKLSDQPKPPTGIAIKSPFEKLNHDLYRPAAQNILASLQLLERKVCEVSNTCAGLKDDNPIDNNSYDNKISELNQNLNDLKENQQKLEKELHGLVLSSNQMNNNICPTQKLKTQNEALEDKNQFLKKKISDLEKQQHEILVAEVQYEANISTQNRFTELTSLNDDMTVTPISEKNREQQYIKKNDENSISKEKPHFLDLEIIIDSHGKGLSASKLYRNVQTKIKVLGPGKKNIKGEGEAILQTTNKDTRHIVLGVGSNDLSIKTTTLCVNEMKTLIDNTKTAILTPRYMFYQRLIVRNSPISTEKLKNSMRKYRNIVKINQMLNSF
ncbi:unnamed protein product [Mytilus edulis]|uniref:Uncharacterized protein n=1 Tax=Mytilus edulis TaxID=6550 RepID=A0A8S3V5H9_MYTED|nr:unnamed protein product [Mytilus edulis]